MEKIQYVIAGAGIVFLLWFLVPFFAGASLNIGNLTGIILSVALFFYGIRKRQIHCFLSELWRNGAGRIFLIIVGILAAVIVLLVLVETAFMIRAAYHRPPENTTAVVLGCKVKGNRPSTVLAERLDAAYEYLISNPKAVCILSGGQGKDEVMSEAQCMYEYLVGMGIDGERLILEDASTSTTENLAFTRAIMEERGLGNEVAIITSEFHMYRASMIAADTGFESYSVPAHTFILYLPTYYVRELYGILYDWLF